MKWQICQLIALYGEIKYLRLNSRDKAGHVWSDGKEGTVKKQFKIPEYDY